MLAKEMVKSIKFSLIHMEVAPREMDGPIFNVDAAYKPTQFTKEEVVFLRKIKLEQFLCNVPWGVIHLVHAAEAVRTI